ncbi:MAG: hypothetical protein WCO10_01210 [bacterium]
MFLELLIKLNTEILPLVYKVLFVLAPIYIPFLLIVVAVKLYAKYVQLKYIAKQEPILLEIKIPKDIQKSPLAMEIVLGAMQQSGAATYSEAWLDGKVAPWFSLELVSIGGEVKFFVWASEKKFKNLLEAQIYAQYPTVEIYPVPNDKDYAKLFTYDPAANQIWGIQYGLTGDDVFPIKTYTDYNLDKDQKDEYRIDPLTAVIEYLGSIGPGQQAWIQVLIRKHGKIDLKMHSFKKVDDWKKAAKAKIEEIRAEATPKPKKEGEYPGFPNPTKGQIEQIAAIERSVNKMAFDTCMRGFYLATKETFNPIYITGIIGSIRQYNSSTLNGFKLKTKTDVTDAFKDWCTVFPFLNDFKDKRVIKLKKLMFNAYKLRSFFYPPYKYYKQDPFILTTEEVATIYHFPGNVSATPSLPKIPSKKSEAPSNLPVSQK